MLAMTTNAQRQLGEKPMAVRHISRVMKAVADADNLLKTNFSSGLRPKLERLCAPLNESRIITKMTNLECVINRQIFHVQLERIYADEAVRTIDEAISTWLEGGK